MPPGRAVPEDVEQACDDIRMALMRLDHHGADVKSQALVEAAADSFAAWAARSSVLYELGKLEAAKEASGRAVTLAMRFFGGQLPRRLRWGNRDERHVIRAIHGRSLVAYRQGNFEEAEQSLNEELRLNPADEQGAKYLLRDVKARRPWKALSKPKAV
jgi:tetratricopeptide (TPR) repeat protein